MTDKAITVLLIEDNALQAKLLLEMLAAAGGGQFSIECANLLSKGLTALEVGGIDVVLLDLSLPDIQGLDSLVSVHCQFPQVPVVVLTGLDDEKAAIDAVKLGAQDYLVKGQVTGSMLARSLHHAIERQTSDERIRQLNDERERRILELASANKTLDSLTRQLMRARDQALEAASFKTDFVARASHEIRTPISTVVGMIELLQKTPLSDEQRQFATAIHDASNVLLSSINSILDLSNIEAGKIELDSIDFSPIVLVEESAEAQAGAAREKGLALMTFIDPSMPMLVTGDPVRLRQVLTNLISNAVQCTARGAVSVQASVQCEDESGVTVRFAVSDTGIGLSETARRQLFEPVIHTNGVTVRKYAGPGLGLSICRRLTELMNGQIGVESEEGDGATFWFSVRLKRSVSIKGQGVSLLAASATHLRDVRVLIVDDFLTSGHILQSYVRAARMRSDLVSKKGDAIEKLLQAAAQRQPYDLVIISLTQSPGTSLALAHAINHEMELSATRLVVVGATPSIEEQKVLDLAGIDFLSRPVRQSQLIDCITRVLDRIELQHTSVSEERHLGRERSQSESVPVVESGEVVLLAEDDTVLQQLVVMQLKRLGHTAQVVSSGHEVVQAAKLSDYGLILMDCQMPGMDGLEATRRIREHEAATGGHVPIVAMTASVMPGDRESCLAAGMDDYMCKPVTLEQLGKIIERWSRRVERESMEITAELEIVGDEAKAGAPSETGLPTPINLGRLQDIYGGQAPNEILHLFVEEARLLISRLRDAIDEKDERRLAMIAHQLVGVSASVAADDMHIYSMELERQAKGGGWETVGQTLRSLETAFGEVVRFERSLSKKDSG